MKGYREYKEYLDEAIAGGYTPKARGKTRDGKPLYAVGSRLFAVSYSPASDETAVFVAGPNGEVEDFRSVVSTRGREGDEEMLDMAIRAIASGQFKPEEDRSKADAERAISRWENRIAQMEAHIAAATRELARMKTDAESAWTALEKGNYRIVQTLTDFKTGSKPWER